MKQKKFQLRLICVIHRGHKRGFHQLVRNSVKEGEIEKRDSDRIIMDRKMRRKMEPIKEIRS